MRRLPHKKQSIREEKLPPVTEKRRSSISVDDFKKIIEGNYVYVDKTSFIQELWESGVDVSVIPRPRRFGKTLNMSTLRYFFEKSETSNAHLFTNLKIWGIPKFRELQGTFPVIFLTLKGLKNALDWKSALKKMQLVIAEEYSRHDYLLSSNSLKPIEKQYFQDVINGTASKEVYANSLKYLSQYLSDFYKKRVIILIDEYDAPLINAHLRNFYDPMISFMQDWLGEGLKGNSYLERSVVTGILRVTKEDLFSTLNNPKIYTVLQDLFADKFGFLEEEVCALLAEYGLTDKLEEIRYWYNGYRIGTKTIYNPWSVINCIDSDGELDPYWINTGNTDLLEPLITKGDASVKSELTKIIAGEESIQEIPEGTTLSALTDDGSSVWNILLYSGYLTLAAPPVKEAGVPKCSLRIPNHEVYCIYKQIIEHWLNKKFTNQNPLKVLRSLVEGDITTFSKLFTDFMLQTMSFHDLAESEPERLYHVIVLSRLAYLFETHELKSNRESGLGRSDILIIPKDTSQLGVVIEIKIFDPKEDKNLNSTAARGLKQIEQKKYVQELYSKGINKVLMLCMAFRGKEVTFKHKEIAQHGRTL